MCFGKVLGQMHGGFYVIVILLLSFGLLAIHVALFTFAGKTNLYISWAIVVSVNLCLLFSCFFFNLVLHFIKNKVFFHQIIAFKSLKTMVSCFSVTSHYTSLFILSRSVIYQAHHHFIVISCTFQSYHHVIHSVQNILHQVSKS